MPPPIDPQRFEQIKATGHLPSPKGVALAIMRLVQRDDVTLVELADVIKSDPAFVGRLIKAANGMLTPGRRPIVSVPDALLVLGMTAVRSMALGFSLLNGFRKGTCQGFDYEGYWATSVIMAIAMQKIASHVRIAAADEMFSLGLLARVGRLALATLYPAAYGKLLAEQPPDIGGSDLAQVEHDAFAVNHAEMSCSMLFDWGLPLIFCEAAGRYEDGVRVEDGSREGSLAAALLFAEGIANWLLAPASCREVLFADLVLQGTVLEFEEEGVRAFLGVVEPEWESWAQMLALGSRRQAVAAEPRRSAEPAANARTSVPQGSESAALRVLVVDDDAAVRGLTAAVLREQGHEVFEAKDGSEGLERAFDLMPDIMLVDWMMPGMDGIELIRSMRASRHGRTIYIILLTVLEDEGRLVEAFEAGADDFIVKPFNPRLLAARLLAGRRVVRLHQELERDREELRHFAAQLAVTNRRLREAALTDPLTGFPNRRYAMERLQQEWAASTRSRRALSCMLVDLDSFKAINDSEGHDAGDRVLHEAAACFKRALRRQDVICRTGGDEFLVICPDTSLAAACGCAERLRAAADALQIQNGDQQLHLTVSVGVAMRDAGVQNVDALIKCADRGAYRAKARGRNQVAAVQLPDEAQGA